MCNSRKLGWLFLFVALLCAASFAQVGGAIVNPSPLSLAGCVSGQIISINSVPQPVCAFPGVIVDAQSGSSYTIAGDGTGSDRLALVWLTNSTTSTAITLAQAGSTNYASNFAFNLCNAGSVVVTITPTTSTINAVAKWTLPPASAASPACVQIFSDNSNWYAINVFPGLSTVFLTSDFTCSTACVTGGTGLVAIGLTFALSPAAAHYGYDCHLTYKESSSSVAIAFAVQDTVTAPTNMSAMGYASLGTTAAYAGVQISSTTATNVLIPTPTVTSNQPAEISGVIEQPAGTASAFQIQGSIASGTLTVKRDSFCTYWIAP